MDMMHGQRDARENDAPGVGLREEIISYVRIFAREKKTPPSVRMILKKFRINRTQFYGIFDGMSELCDLAGVGEAEERNIQVKSALEARQRQEPEAEVNPKKAFDATLNKFEENLERSRYMAMSDPSKALDYASKVVPVLDPTLWRRLQLFDANLENSVRLALSVRGSYLDLLQRAKITHEKVPEFDDFMIERLKNFVSVRIDRGLYALATPGDADDKCPRCHTHVQFSANDASYPLICRACNEYRTVHCPVCGEQMGRLPPRMLKCTKCAYRLKFREDLKKQILTVEDYFDEVAAGRVPSEGEIVFTQKLPDGRTSYTPVTVRPGQVPGRVQTEIHTDREFIA